MKQEYKNYTDEDFEVWKILFDRQVDNLKGKVHPIYFDCLESLSDVLNGEEVPEFSSLESKLKEANGWSIEVVPGIIPVDDFFELLSRKRFCSSTWLRKKSQLDYLEEPDMFHDIFGHIPLLMHKEYAEFMQRIGMLGVKYKHNDEIVIQLKRLYWFTIEFGLCHGSDNIQIYGAGTISSYGETLHIYNDDVLIHDFDVQKVAHKAFSNSEIQNEYFALSSFDDLYNTIDAYVSECL